MKKSSSSEKCYAHQYSYKTSSSRKSNVKNKKDTKSNVMNSDSKKTDVDKIFVKNLAVKILIKK